MSSVYLEHRDAYHVPGPKTREEITKAIDKVAEALLNCDAWMVTAGAGMGVDSGMPDFRGKTGLWHDRETPITWEETSDEKWFTQDPAFAWGMFYTRLDMYRTKTPHEGFQVLLKWAAELGKPYYVFTSNVDGHFQKAGFPEEKVVACHGDFSKLQCADRMCMDPKNPEDQLWSADCIPKGLGADGGIDKNYTFADPAALDASYFHCPRCGKLSRPNVWMCKDRNYVSRKSSHDKYDQFAKWKDDLQKAQAKVVVFECGGGMVIPSIRVESEDMVDWCGDGSLLVRMNPKDTNVPAERAAGLPLGCREALERIDQRLHAVRRGGRARSPSPAPKAGAKAKAAKAKAVPKAAGKAKAVAKAATKVAGGEDALLQDAETKMLRSKALEIFKHLDENDDGWISRADMARVFELLGAGINADKLLQTLDQSGDDRIDYTMFLKWVMNDASPADLVQALTSDASYS